MIYEATKIKKKVRTIVQKEKEDMLLDYDPNMHLYNKGRVLSLENHLKILEDYKKQADYHILLLQEEMLKLKNEILVQKEETKKLRITSRWRITALRDKKQRDATQKKQALDDVEENGEDAITPLQVITRTVGRLSKVSDMLDTADLKTILMNIFKNLAAGDLYGPTDKLLAEMAVDEMAKQFIISTYTDRADDFSLPSTPTSKASQSLGTSKVMASLRKNYF